MRRGPSSPYPSRRTWPPWSWRRATLFLPSQPSPPLRGNSRPCGRRNPNPTARGPNQRRSRRESGGSRRRFGKSNGESGPERVRIRRRGPERGGRSPYLSFRLPPTPTSSRKALTKQRFFFFCATGWVVVAADLTYRRRTPSSTSNYADIFQGDVGVRSFGPFESCG